MKRVLAFEAADHLRQIPGVRSIQRLPVPDPLFVVDSAPPGKDQPFTD